MSYCYSTNGENYLGEFATIKDAVNEAFGEVDCDETDDKYIYAGEIDKRSAADYLCQGAIERLFEGMSEQAGEFVGDVSEGWLNFPCPALIIRNRETKVVYHARELTEEERQKKQKVWELHDAAMVELTENIKKLVDRWTEDYGHQPDFWGVKNVFLYSRDGEVVGGL